MTANSLLSVLDMNYVTYTGKCVQYILSFIGVTKVTKITIM